MFRERMERLTGKERPWTSMSTFEEALGSGMSARTATEIGFTEMLQDEPKLLETIQSAPDGEKILNSITVDMDGALQRVLTATLPQDMSDEDKKRKQALVLRMEFAKSVLRHQPKEAPIDVDFSKLDIDMDTLRAEGEALLHSVEHEQEDEDLSFFGEDETGGISAAA